MSNDQNSWASVGGKERILLVDDDNTVLLALSSVLEGLGYQVTAFSDPTEAMENFRAQPDYYDLVITDMSMPQLSGLEVIRQIFLICPEKPTILHTGYAEEVETQEADELGIRAYITKPVRRKELDEAVRRALS